MGVQLFERSRSGVIPTVAGEVLREQARRFLELEANTRALVTQAGEIDDQIQVGLAPGLSSSELAQRVANARQQVPRVRLRFEQHASLTQLRLLSERRLDLCFVHEPPPSQMRSHSFGPQPFGLALRPGHPLAGKPSLALQDAHGLKVLSHADDQAPTSTRLLVERFADAGVAVSWHFQSFSDYAMVWAEAWDVAAAAMVERSAHQRLPGWVWRPVDDLGVMLETWLVWLPHAREVVQQVACSLADNAH